MTEYISRETIRRTVLNYNPENPKKATCWAMMITDLLRDIDNLPAADVQPKRYCRMIPLEPDCRGYTDVFICTNCHQHIHLGFIRKEYSGSYCLECGAEVKDGDTE